LAQSLSHPWAASNRRHARMRFEFQPGSSMSRPSTLEVRRLTRGRRLGHACPCFFPSVQGSQTAEGLGSPGRIPLAAPIRRPCHHERGIRRVRRISGIGPLVSGTAKRGGGPCGHVKSWRCSVRGPSEA
jgi:hypothetical protein